mmetsp:Transcript_1041/g.2032  ORF Transcript_1041/g.2032 Transcript_1041/m.2032 type:complete len:354 (-) Transcript_1041:29-1090(-)
MSQRKGGVQAKTVRSKSSKKNVKSKSKPKQKSFNDAETNVQDTDFAVPEVALSPFYSFSSHWSHITRQYLCLTSWGTCMGGINEQYDDIMEYEASMPLVDQNYKQSFEKWKKHKKEYEQQQATIDSHEKEQQPAVYVASNDSHRGQHYANKNIPMNPDVSVSNNDSSKHQETYNRAQVVEVETETENVLENDTKNAIEPTTIDTEPELVLVSTQQSSMPQPQSHDHGRPSQRSVNPSFGRKVDLYNTAIVIKRKKTVEEEEWKSKRKSSASPQFKPMDNDGQQYIETFAATPVARGVVNSSTKKVSNKQYSSYTKAFQDQSAIVTNDEAANAPATAKIEFFQRLSLGPDANID